jgi:N-alpha-acetyltransferase 15/16, NatA auxiliary subunit
MIRNNQVQDAENTMSLFSKEGNELNVHDMQCMWYEVEVGDSYYRQGNYRMALKNYTYVEKHLDQIFEDQFDFHLYAIRKYTLNSYLQMIDMSDQMHRNKNAVRAALGAIRTLSKVNKIRTQELEKLQPEFEAYKASKEYKDLIEDLRKRDEDDDYRNDYDPKGYEAYEKAVRNRYYI